MGSVSRENAEWNSSTSLPDDFKGILRKVCIDEAEMISLDVSSLFFGMQVYCVSEKSLWTYVEGQASTEADEQNLLQQVHSGVTADSWLRSPGAAVLKLAIGFADTDGEALLTVPSGVVFRLAGHPWYEITTAFTGGSSSAIGLSTNISGYETGGDIIGGATGDVAAGLTAGTRAGTLGGELDDTTGFQELLFVEDSEVQFDRITSAFTAGAGFVHIPVVIQHV